MKFSSCGGGGGTSFQRWIEICGWCLPTYGCNLILQIIIYNDSSNFVQMTLIIQINLSNKFEGGRLTPLSDCAAIY